MRQTENEKALEGAHYNSPPPAPCSSWKQSTLGTTKPRFLEQLENYLRKELLLLDLSTDSAQELRLQVRAKELLWAGQGEGAGRSLTHEHGARETFRKHQPLPVFGVPVPDKRNMFYDKANEQERLPVWN